MNNKRRKEISKVIEQLEISKSDIETILEDEEEAFYNMPENLLDSERAEVSRNAIDLLGEAINNLEEVVENLEEAQE